MRAATCMYAGIKIEVFGGPVSLWRCERWGLNVVIVGVGDVMDGVGFEDGGSDV